MRLLEIIPTPETDRAAIDAVAHFCDVHLGKGVVIAKDTPNFIANRIGTFSVLNVMRLMQEMDLTIEEVDALTGHAVGWPKSATFRTIDLVGLDILGHVVGNMTTNVHDERSDLRLPDFFNQMLENKWLGDKTKGGFYKKSKGGERQGRRTPGARLEDARIPSAPEAKIPRARHGKEHRRPRRAPAHAARPRWQRPAERRQSRSVPVVRSLRSLDLLRQPRSRNFRLRRRNRPRHAPRLQLGAGSVRTLGRRRRRGHRRAHEERRASRSPPMSRSLLARDKKSWYLDDPKAPSGRKYWDLSTENWEPVQVPAGVWSVDGGEEIQRRGEEKFRRIAGRSGRRRRLHRVPLQDELARRRHHQLITQTLKPGGPGDGFDAFVITNDATNFSVGANLMLLLMCVQEEEWDDVDLAIRQFQGMTQAIKFSPKPVVVCAVRAEPGRRHRNFTARRGPPAARRTLHRTGGSRRRPAARRRRLQRDAAARGRQRSRIARNSPAKLAARSVELMEAMKKAFETIATAKVATSAHEARGLGFLSDSDRITMNRERVLSDAKARALELVRAGYEPPVPRTDIPAPGESILAALKMGVHLMRQGDYITDHEVKIGGKVAEVLCGGNVTPGTPVSEQYILDLEREGFKSLCGEKKTQERIQYTLKTGKTLRN